MRVGGVERVGWDEVERVCSSGGYGLHLLSSIPDLLE